MNGNSTYILGLNCMRDGHDPTAALLKDGHLICMIEQERISRRKRAIYESPSEAIAACLEYANISLEDVNAIAIGWDVPGYLQTLDETYDESSFREWILPAERFGSTLATPFYFVPHHLAHAASAFWTSGLERAVILVIDGRGETQATTIALGTPEGIEVLEEWDVAQSLGNYYGWATSWAGLSFWDPGKLMGLAAYGRPTQNVPLIPTSTGYTFLNRPSSHILTAKRPKVSPETIQRLALFRHFQRENYLVNAPRSEQIWPANMKHCQES